MKKRTYNCWCGRRFEGLTTGRANKYCSTRCHQLIKAPVQPRVCHNPDCHQVFSVGSGVKPGTRIYCSASCALEMKDARDKRRRGRPVVERPGREQCPRCGQADVVETRDGCACLTCGWMPGSTMDIDKAGYIALPRRVA